MATWTDGLKHDPIKPLANCSYPAIKYYARRDLLGDEVEPIQTLWGLPDTKKLLRYQRGDGSWTVPLKYQEKSPDVNYSLVETFRRLRELVGKYEFNRSHPTISSAAKFVFTCQSAEGDIRGFYVDQYAPHYTGLYMELLVGAGYGDDPRIAKAIGWLIAHRQRDGGWVYPPLAAGISWAEEVYISSHHAGAIPFEAEQPQHNRHGAPRARLPPGLRPHPRGGEGGGFPRRSLLPTRLLHLLRGWRLLGQVPIPLVVEQPHHGLRFPPPNRLHGRPPKSA
jgi:hypothetical protein